jgi:biopolymer transport protein ExbD
MITRRSFVVALGLGALSAHAFAQTSTVLIVAIDPQGAITVDGRPADDDAAIRAAARAAVASHGEHVTGRVEPATHTPQSVVTHVLDILRAAGLTQVAVSIPTSR